MRTVPYENAAQRTPFRRKTVRYGTDSAPARGYDSEHMGASESARGASEPDRLPGPFGNRLLAALSEVTRARVAASIDVVALRRQQFTNRYDTPMRTVDFPIDAVMSVVATLANGSTCEVATVGREGFVEVDAALASRIAHRTSFCQIPGHVARMPIEAFQAELDTNREFKAFVMRAVRTRTFMTEQLAMCNLKHTIVERFARWLLMTRDRRGAPRVQRHARVLGDDARARAAQASRKPQPRCKPPAASRTAAASSRSSTTRR